MDSDLYNVVTCDDVDALKGSDWPNVHEQLTPGNNTVLHLACRHGRTRCVEEILSSHESLLIRINSRGETALHIAARGGHYGAVEALIRKARSSVLKPNNLQKESSTLLQDLIRAPNAELDTALHVAVRYNHNDVVELLAKEDPSYSYPQNKYFETPLYLASVRRYTDSVNIILDNCQSPSFDGPNGRTALHAASMSYGGYGCMMRLLENNNDLINVAENNGWTAFHYVAHNDLVRSAKYLLSVNKSVAYLPDKILKRTALHVAAYKGKLEVMKEILNILPDAWESVDGNGHNILHIAVLQEQKSVIQFIVSGDFEMKSSLLSQRDKFGCTPLHLIAERGLFFPELVDALYWRPDWDTVNNKNITIFEALYEKETGALIDEGLVGGTISLDTVGNHWNHWVGRKVVEVERVDEESIKWQRQMVNTHVIVAALITTVALTAGFDMPGGFDGNQGPNQGSAVLSRKTAFKIFMVADTIALLFSISSLFLYFLTAMYDATRVLGPLISAAVVLNVVSITAMMLAFIAGTYAVLAHSSFLRISVCIISSLFFLLVFYVCIKFFRKIYTRYKKVAYAMSD
ncbi:protein ACCELERATED CELL DEATH 6-like isoform X1 [Daucus carota subsp. sativus]|uniref:protein ACCELERATED CELL DEATH 6-like isoform X1 n=1 Tax=Daucus carota subsp. sativus TaxID=79200 RepID=UPI003082EB18